MHLILFVLVSELLFCFSTNKATHFSSSSLWETKKKTKFVGFDGATGSESDGEGDGGRRYALLNTHIYKYLLLGSWGGKVLGGGTGRLSTT